MNETLNLLYSNLTEAKIRQYNYKYISLKYKDARVYTKYIFIVNWKEKIQ